MKLRLDSTWTVLALAGIACLVAATVSERNSRSMSPSQPRLGQRPHGDRWPQARQPEHGFTRSGIDDGHRPSASGEAMGTNGRSSDPQRKNWGVVEEASDESFPASDPPSYTR